MRVGIIDLGTNSVRFAIHELGPKSSVKELHREKIMVRLGQGVFLRGRLDETAMERTLRAFLRFKHVGQNFRVSKIVAFATSALREVSDRDRFVKLIYEKTGIEIRVISGGEEANLIALGVLANERLPKGRFGLIDIGGGSTEISICQGKQVLFSHSFPIGTARIQQVFLKKSPPNPEDLEALRKFIRTTLFQTLLVEGWPPVNRLYGSSGTIRALGKILRRSKSAGTLVEGSRLRALIKRLKGQPIESLLATPRMEARRVDMIVGGAVILEECMRALGAKETHGTQFSLRDGILEEELQLIHEGQVSHLALHFSEFYEKAKAFGGNEAHLRRNVKIAEDLFDKLKTLHKLKDQWKIYLSTAVILRDVGESVNAALHQLHSYYIVKNAELPAMEQWELEFVAQLCLQHEEVTLESKAIPFALPKVLSFAKNKIEDKERKQAFKRLLMLLKLVDALDSGPESYLRIKNLKVTRLKVELLYSGQRLTGLEEINVELIQPDFFKTFGKTIQARRGLRA